MKKKLPDFKDEDDERKFWATADSTQYVDWASGKRRKFVHSETTGGMGTDRWRHRHSTGSY
jgi:hypothetical protein